MRETEVLSALLDRARAGDSAAWDDVFRLIEYRLKRVVSQEFPDRPSGVGRWLEQSDVAQDLRIKLLTHLSVPRNTPKSMRHLYRLLSKILKRLIIDYYRSTFGPRGHGSHYRSFGGEADLFDALPASVCGNTSTFERQSEFEELFRLIERLPKEQAEAIHFTFVWGHTVEETAGLMQMSMGKVSGLISEGKKALGRMYKAEDR
jgi:RNA polymerase sigma factor (sigma-70 family)